MGEPPEKLMVKGIHDCGNAQTRAQAHKDSRTVLDRDCRECDAVVVGEKPPQRGSPRLQPASCMTVEAAERASS